MWGDLPANNIASGSYNATAVVQAFGHGPSTRPPAGHFGPHWLLAPLTVHGGVAPWRARVVRPRTGFSILSSEIAKRQNRRALSGTPRTLLGLIVQLDPMSTSFRKVRPRARYTDWARDATPHSPLPYGAHGCSGDLRQVAVSRYRRMLTVEQGGAFAETAPPLPGP